MESVPVHGVVHAVVRDPREPAVMLVDAVDVQGAASYRAVDIAVVVADAQEDGYGTRRGLDACRREDRCERIPALVVGQVASDEQAARGGDGARCERRERAAVGIRRADDAGDPFDLPSSVADDVFRAPRRLVLVLKADVRVGHDEERHIPLGKGIRGRDMNR